MNVEGYPGRCKSKRWIDRVKDAMIKKRRKMEVEHIRRLYVSEKGR